MVHPVKSIGYRPRFEHQVLGRNIFGDFIGQASIQADVNIQLGEGA
jgi:hypothetical protein